jgi:orotate phosphoribosyltransferase
MPQAARNPAVVCAWETLSVEELFAQCGALLDGHFLLTSGRHAGRYLEKFFVLQYPAAAVEICRRFAEQLARFEPTLVVGPTTGGVLLAHETARQLEELGGRGVRGIFAERVDSGGDTSGGGAVASAAVASGSGRALRRGWTVAADERVVLVDDILTTGVSLVETLGAVRAAGAEPLAAAVIVDRSTAPVDLGGVPLISLGRIEVPSWAAEECPLCASGVPLRKPGSH